MFGLSHLFYPWGILVQIIALVHFVRRRPENYWLFIILFGGIIGASAYVLVEILPDANLLRGIFQGFGRRSRIQALEKAVESATLQITATRKSVEAGRPIKE